LTKVNLQGILQGQCQGEIAALSWAYKTKKGVFFSK